MLSDVPTLFSKHASKGFLFWLMLTVLAGLLVWQIIRLVLLLVSPVTPLGAWQPRQAIVVPIAERKAILTRYNPFNGSNVVTAQRQGPVRVTALDLVLYGTRINADGAGGADQGAAIVAGSDGVQRNYLVGEEVLPGVTLVGVAFDNITLERNGARESLFIDQSDDITPVDPANISRPDAVPEDVDIIEGPTGPPALVAGVSFAPRRDGDRVTGLTLAPRGDGEQFERLGFRLGDVVVEYDGQRVTSTNDISSLTAKARPGGRFSLLVERGANVVPIAIIVPEN